MHPTVSQYAQALEELTRDMPVAEVSDITKNFIQFLRQRGEGTKLGTLIKLLEKRAAEKESRIEVTVILAHESDKEIKEKLFSQAEKLFPHKKVKLQYTVDDEMIGGALFRTDEVLYDTTVSSELNSFKKALSKAA